MTLVISGMHRSGTTHLGKIVSSGYLSSTIHEPTNYLLGDSRVPCWYPSKADFLNYFDLYEYALINPEHLKSRLYKRVPGESIVRSIGRSVLGGTYEKSLKAYRQNSDQSFILKDPFLMRILPDISQSFISLITVKHPLANLSSVNRQSWSINWCDYSKHIEVDVDLIRLLKTKFNTADSNFLCLWYFLHKELIKNKKKNMHVIWHENFCLHPYEIVNVLSGLKHSADLKKEPLKRAIQESMFSSETGDAVGLHRMMRNSSSVATGWKKEFSSDEINFIDECFSEIIHEMIKLSVV